MPLRLGQAIQQRYRGASWQTIGYCTLVQEVGTSQPYPRFDFPTHLGWHLINTGSQASEARVCRQITLTLMKQFVSHHLHHLAQQHPRLIWDSNHLLG